MRIPAAYNSSCFCFESFSLRPSSALVSVRVARSSLSKTAWTSASAVAAVRPIPVLPGRLVRFLLPPEDGCGVIVLEVEVILMTVFQANDGA